jgi:hypothetical protein
VCVLATRYLHVINTLATHTYRVKWNKCSCMCVCIGAHRYISVYIGTYRCISVHIGVYRYISVYTCVSKVSSPTREHINKRRRIYLLPSLTYPTHELTLLTNSPWCWTSVLPSLTYTCILLLIWHVSSYECVPHVLTSVLPSLTHPTHELIPLTNSPRCWLLSSLHWLFGTYQCLSVNTPPLINVFSVHIYRYISVSIRT